MKFHNLLASFGVIFQIDAYPVVALSRRFSKHAHFFPMQPTCHVGDSDAISSLVIG